MPYTVIGGSALWLLADFALYKSRYPHGATTADDDFHMVIGIIGVILIILLSMMLDLKSHDSKPVSVNVCEFICILCLLAVYIMLVADIRFIMWAP